MYPVAGEKSKQEALVDGLYETLAPVGRGRNSIVYRARRIDAPDSGEILALKVIVGSNKEPEASIKRTKREAIAMLSSINRNVIKLRDYVARRDLCYLAMEFAERGDIKATLDLQEAPLAPEVVLRLMVQLASGLEAIHRAGIVHRDVKPENLLLTEDLTLKIADFGIAFLPSEQVALEEANRGVGTFDYLAPECLEEGLSNEATDVYSAAVTMYQLLTRELPFVGETFTEQINNKMSSRIVPPERFVGSCPPLLSEFLATALRSDPADRFKSASEFRAALEALIDNRWEPPVAALPPSRAHAAVEDAAGEEEHEDDPLWDELIAEGGEHDVFSGHVDEYEENADEYIPEAEDDSLDYLPADEQLEPSDTSDELLIAEDLPVGGRDVTKKFVRPETPRRRLPGLVLFATALLVVGGLLFWSLRIPSLREVVDGLFAGSPEPASDSPAPAAELPAADERAAAPATDFQALARTAYAGSVEGLLADGETVTLFAEPGLGNRQVIIGLALDGWQPNVLDSSALAGKKSLTIESGGLVLTLNIDADSGVQGAALSGTFKERVSGRQGSWALW